MDLKRELQDINDWFLEYTDNFRINNPGIKDKLKLKVDHTKRVRKECELLAKDLNFSKRDILISELIGILHDIGRFEQYTKYETYSDNKSVNHAELGIKIIDRYNILKNFNNSDKELIKKSVKNHNKKDVRNIKQERELLFCKLIRDADKIDALKISIHFYNRKETSIFHEMPDNHEYSDSIVDSLFNNELANMNNMKSVNDFKLIQAGWIFDINFDYTYRRFREEKYLESIFKTLPKDEKMKKLYNYLKTYLEEKT